MTVPPPPRSDGRGSVARALGGCALAVGLALAALWAASYFILGVDPLFLLGLARAVTSPPRTPADLVVPAGVTATVWAEGLASPTSLAFGPDGRLYVTELGGQVVALADADGDGAASPTERQVYASGLTVPLGLAFYETDLYIGHRGGITRLADSDGDGSADEREVLVSDLPAARHQTDGLAFGPDGRLYIGQGSTSDRGETGLVAREASILVMERDGSGLRVFASGTRNPYDLAFYPGTELLFATDNGQDVPASGVPDELNLIVDGGDYGWRRCWGIERGPNCAGTLAARRRAAQPRRGGRHRLLHRRRSSLNGATTPSSPSTAPTPATPPLAVPSCASSLPKRKAPGPAPSTPSPRASTVPSTSLKAPTARCTWPTSARALSTASVPSDKRGSNSN